MIHCGVNLISDSQVNDDIELEEGKCDPDLDGLIFELLPERHGIYSRFKDKKALLQNIKTAFQKADLNRDGLINDVVAKECYIVLDLTKKALAHCFKEPEIPECFRETSFK